ncbi:alpha/beta fold hydrolase [Hyphomicrobium sp. MC1]|uniref:alpha/beta fold hydrolase n=1 Tax=Hyphomicrobium sp. (strain MC1) TaxID=717785 RepID=UPI000213E912|nr:alpha/beta hydrolase [Hyphomicrobium sp. MC1]CCB66574.1 Predicted hydrolase or acyltransferase [Hyphomicrobium sp. MC1]
MSFEIADIDGAKVEYRLEPPHHPGFPTIVFLHEGLGSAALWKDFPKELAEQTGCGILVYSRAGYGRSQAVSLPRPVDYMQKEGLEFLPSVLEHFGLRDVILFGHSDGATIALVACAGPAAKYVKGAVIEAPHVVIEPITVSGIAKLADEFRKGPLKARLERHHGTNTDCAFWGFAGTWLNLENARSWTIVPLLQSINQPLLVIQGDRDAFGTAYQVHTIAKSVSGVCAVQMLAGCGHAPHVEARANVLDETSRFIAHLTADRAVA